MRSSLLFVFVFAACGPATTASTQQIDEAGEFEELAGPYDDWYDFATCRGRAETAANECSADCARRYPPGSDPSPDDTCPAGEFRGPIALAYLSCHTDCEITHANAQLECCTWGVVNGRPIDWTSDTDAASVCRSFACSAQVEPEYGQCLANYGGYTQQNVFSIACKMDVFGFCDPIWNDGCAAGWQPPQITDCDAAMPDDFNARVAQLSDARFATREAGERALANELAEIINDYGAPCAVDKVRSALDAAIANADPEARWRLQRIKSGLL